jgi:hypothetical protein
MAAPVVAVVVCRACRLGAGVAVLTLRWDCRSDPAGRFAPAEGLGGAGAAILGTALCVVEEKTGAGEGLYG